MIQVESTRTQRIQVELLPALIKERNSPLKGRRADPWARPPMIVKGGQYDPGEGMR